MLICGKTTIGFCLRVKSANTKVGSKNKVERIYQTIGQKKF